MTLSLPDMSTPAQPPPDGLRALLAFAALTVGVYLAAAVLLILVFGSDARAAAVPVEPGEVVTLWNRLCASEEARIEALGALNASLHARHPQRGLDAPRFEFYTAAIIESERQTALLKAMRRAEFGKTGSQKEGTGADEPPRDRMPALSGVDVALRVRADLDGR
jgi:hypothetical protein